jgi:ribosomal protein S3
MNLIEKIYSALFSNYSKGEPASVNTRRRVLLAFSYFLEEMDINRDSWEVTDITIYEDEDTVSIKVTLCRPGLLIGKGGATYDALKEHLQETFPDKKIVLQVEESHLWHY